MTASRGVCLIAYGNKAQMAMEKCLQSLHWQLPYQCNPVTPLHLMDDVQRSRWAKVTLPTWSPFEETLYLDADTIVYQPDQIRVGFDMLSDGWDLVIIPSSQQDQSALWHLSAEEREYTWLHYRTEALVLQGGVFWYRQSSTVEALFTEWYNEWVHWGKYDQGALLRALRKVPVKIHLLGRPFNGGSVIAHHFGEAS